MIPAAINVNKTKKKIHINTIHFSKNYWKRVELFIFSTE